MTKMWKRKNNDSSNTVVLKDMPSPMGQVQNKLLFNQLSLSKSLSLIY